MGSEMCIRDRLYTGDGCASLQDAPVHPEMPFSFDLVSRSAPVSITDFEEQMEADRLLQQELYRFCPPEEAVDNLGLAFLGLPTDQIRRFKAAAATNPRIHQAFLSFHSALKDFAFSGVDFITEHYLHSHRTFAQANHVRLDHEFRDVDVREPEPHTSREEHVRR